MISKSTGVSDRSFPMPTKKNMDLMAPNAKDNPDTITPSNPYKQALGGSGKPKGPFGKSGREF
jgi:hypothetical protein